VLNQLLQDTNLVQLVEQLELASVEEAVVLEFQVQVLTNLDQVQPELLINLDLDLEAEQEQAQLLDINQELELLISPELPSNQEQAALINQELVQATAQPMAQI
jgi:hypothetical protein